jgi:polyisoprenyl-phosphate glycosyltransferase
MTNITRRDTFIPDSTDIFDVGREENKPLISIVVPARNEERNIARLEQELVEATNPLPYRFEFLVIDNSSQDNTPALVKEICARDKRWKYIRFSRNFTVEGSIAAGYHYASGEAMIVLYSDLQEPPSMISAFLQKWREGYDVVYGVHTARHGETALFSYMVHLAYKFVNWCSSAPIPENSGDFRLISRRVRDAFEQCGGDYHRYTRGLIAWLGFPSIGIKYERRPRLEGRSNSDFSVYWAYFSNAITGFSMTPLRFFTLLAVISGVLTVFLIGAACFCFVDQLKAQAYLFSFMALQIGLATLQFFGIGMLGEYVGRTYTEGKHRPLYIIEESANLPRVVDREATLNATSR